MGSYRDHLLNAAALAADLTINDPVTIKIADELQRAMHLYMAAETSTIDEQLIDERLAAHLAAALADPDVGYPNERDTETLKEAGFNLNQTYAINARAETAARALAGYLLDRVTNHEEVPDS